MQEITRSKEFIDIINKKPKAYINWGIIIVPFLFISFFIFLFTQNHKVDILAEEIICQNEKNCLFKVMVRKNELLGLQKNDHINIFFYNKTTLHENYSLKGKVEKVSPEEESNYSSLLISSSDCTSTINKLNEQTSRIKGQKTYFSLLFL